MIATWVKEEMASVDLGDERLDDRLAVVLSALGKRPNVSIPAACGGRDEMKAAYRFFDNDKVTLSKVIAPHVARSKERMAEHPVVLLVQDTTEIDLTRPEQQVAGAGELDGTRRGILLHEMQAFTPEGTPLGTVWADVLNRTAGVSKAAAAEKQRQREHTPIEAKESLRWLTGLREARQLAQELPAVQCICVADSDADIYELFAEPRGVPPPVHWLIRACQDRALDGWPGQPGWPGLRYSEAPAEPAVARYCPLETSQVAITLRNSPQPFWITIIPHQLLAHPAAHAHVPPAQSPCQVSPRPATMKRRCLGNPLNCRSIRR